MLKTSKIYLLCHEVNINVVFEVLVKLYNVWVILAETQIARKLEMKDLLAFKEF